MQTGTFADGAEFCRRRLLSDENVAEDVVRRGGLFRPCFFFSDGAFWDGGFSEGGLCRRGLLPTEILAGGAACARRKRGGQLLSTEIFPDGAFADGDFCRRGFLPTVRSFADGAEFCHAHLVSVQCVLSCRSLMLSWFCFGFCPSERTLLEGTLLEGKNRISFLRALFPNDRGVAKLVGGWRGCNVFTRILQWAET